MEVNEFSAQLGQNLKSIRTLLGLSAEQLGEQIGITADAVYKYERGERAVTMEFAYRAAVALGCSIQDFEYNLDPRTRDGSTQLRHSTRLMSREEHANMRWLAAEWGGDVRALVTMMTLVARFPEEERREIYMQAELTKDRLIAQGILTPEDLPQGMDYMQEQLGGLYGQVR